MWLFGTLNLIEKKKKKERRRRRVSTMTMMKYVNDKSNGRMNRKDVIQQ